MAEKARDYFGWDKMLSLILAIIPVTAWVLGAAVRFKEGKILAGVLRVIFGFSIIWIVDLVFMIKDGQIARFVNY